MPEQITVLRGKTVVLPRSNIDTDQIIPARFLTTTTRRGLGRHAFADWRARGDCPVDDPRAAGASILVAGDNFGCGSSREHAPWALYDLGLRAVLTTGLADIFRANALKNGLVAVEIDAAAHAWLQANPFVEVVVDLERQCVEAAGLAPAHFEIERFARQCLMCGVDELGYLLAQTDAIVAFEQRGR